MPDALTHADVNAILSQPDQSPWTAGLSEQDEREIENAMLPIFRRLGPDDALLLVARLALPFEPYLRATEPADHPSLVLIDELRTLGRLG